MTQKIGPTKTCRPERLNRLLAVDHDHTTGKVRGLLCMDCNVTLGRWKDNVSIMHAAIEYIEKI